MTPTELFAEIEESEGVEVYLLRLFLALLSDDPAVHNEYVIGTRALVGLEGTAGIGMDHAQISEQTAGDFYGLLFLVLEGLWENLLKNTDERLTSMEGMSGEEMVAEINRVLLLVRDALNLYLLVDLPEKKVVFQKLT